MIKQINGKQYTECEAILIGTNKKSNIGFDNKFQYNRFGYKYEWFKPHHLYLTINEDIKEGDWFVVGNNIRKCIKNNDSLGYFNNDKSAFLYIQPNFIKIIASSDPSLDLPFIPESSQMEFVATYGNIKSVFVQFNNIVITGMIGSSLLFEEEGIIGKEKSITNPCNILIEKSSMNESENDEDLFSKFKGSSVLPPPYGKK